MSEKPGVEFQALRKTYGDKVAVDGLTLTLRAGEAYCLLGPNGAGKTSTINVLAGLSRPSGGEVLLNGVSVRSPEIHEARRALGYLPDVPDLYDYLTGREMLHFVAELYGVEGDLPALIAQWLTRLDFGPDADQLTKTYSLGMRKKIAIGCALIYQPTVLVLDEPTGSLDAATARVVKDLVREARAEGRVVLFTTHVMEIAEQLADRIGILHHGRLIAEGSPAELKATHGWVGDTLEDLFLRLTGTPRAVAASPRA